MASDVKIPRAFTAFIVHLLFQCTAGVLYASPVQMNSTVKIVSEKSVLLTEDTVILSHRLPLMELETAIDNEIYRLESLRHSSDLNFFRPEVVKRRNYYFTLFRRSMPMALAVQLCKTISLQVLDIQNMPKTFGTTDVILLQLEISVHDTVICTGPSLVLKGQDCLSYMLQYTESREFFRRAPELEKYLKENYLEQTLALACNDTNYFFSTSLRGTVGCFGAMEERTRDAVQRQHDIYYSQLYSISLALLSAIDTCTNSIDETVHSLAAETFSALLGNPHEDLAVQIYNAVPSYLPDHLNKLDAYQHFQTFFKKSMLESQEGFIGNLKNMTLIQTLSERNKKLILGSLNQYQMELKIRLADFISSMNPGVAMEVSSSVLMKQTQNPVSFIQFIQGLVINLDEAVLSEAFIILQNIKYSLLQDVGAVLKEKVYIPSLSHSDFSTILRKEQSSTQLLRQDLKSSSVSLTRSKRSWSSFWSTVWGTATEDDIKEVFSNEIDLSRHEVDLESKILNVSKTNTHLTDSLQRFSASVQTLEKRQGKLFSDIGDVLSASEKFYDNIKSLYELQDKGLWLSSEYLSVINSITLILHTLSKVQSLIETSLSNELDFTQVPTASLRSLLPNNFRLSLSTVEASFKFTASGYIIEYTVPKYSEAYQVYELKQVPYLQNRTWYKISDIDTVVVMNKIHDYLLMSEVITSCSLRNKYYLCPMGSITVRKSKTSSCKTELIAAAYSNRAAFEICKRESIYYSSGQTFIAKENKLYLACPGSQDSLTESCPGLNDTVYSVDIGLNLYILKNRCRYETSELTMYGPREALKVQSWLGRDPEIQLVYELASAESTLGFMSPPFSEENELKSLVEKYKDDETVQGRKFSALQNELEDMDSITNLNSFNPVKFNLRNPWHVSNWINLLFWTIAIFSLLLIAYCCCPKLCKRCAEQSRKLGKSVLNKLRCKRTDSDSLSMHYHQGQQEEADVVGRLLDNRQPSPIVRIRQNYVLNENNADPHFREIGRYSPLPDNLGSEPRDPFPAELNWEYSVGERGELLLTHKLKIKGTSTLIYFDVYDFKVYDFTGKVFPKVKTPSAAILDKYYQDVNSRALPPLNKKEGRPVCLRNHPQVEFSSEGLWMDRASNKPVCGLKPPTA